MTFKERAYECTGCGDQTKALRWSTDPVASCVHCGAALAETGQSWAPNRGVIDDQLEGGPRRFETMGDDAPFIESKSQWRREVERRGLVNVVRRDASYYAKQRKMHDERLRDTGRAD
jgi:hypothetical protein